MPESDNELIQKFTVAVEAAKLAETDPSRAEGDIQSSATVEGDIGKHITVIQERVFDVTLPIKVQVRGEERLKELLGEENFVKWKVAKANELPYEEVIRRRKEKLSKQDELYGNVQKEIDKQEAYYNATIQKSKDAQFGVSRDGVFGSNIQVRRPAWGKTFVMQIPNDGDPEGITIVEIQVAPKKVPFYKRWAFSLSLWWEKTCPQLY